MELPAAKSALPVKRKFSILPNSEGSRYSLTQEGEEGEREFKSFHAALKHARSCSENYQATVVLFDLYGRETIEFRLNLPEPQLRLMFRKPRKRARLKEKNARERKVSKITRDISP